MAINVSTKPKKSTLQVRERNMINLSEKYSSPLVNYTEVNRIDGIDYTKFYTEVDTNLNVGERVFIVNGNYDTNDIIKECIYRSGSNGYTILEIDKCSITLDIKYNGKSTWISDEFDEYIKIYGCTNNQQRDYEVLQNGYYPYKYMYGYRGNNNILFCSTTNTFKVANPYTNVSDFNNWVDITADFNLNSFPNNIGGNNITPNNGKLLIMSSFTHGGILFEEGYVYKYESGNWIKDNKSRKSYLTKGNFRDGSFDGNWNDGVFGQFDKKINWNGAKWRNGIFYHSNWVKGTMESKSDSISRQSYYSGLDNGSISNITDFNNNYGFGYNFTEDSHFIEANILNTNATNCIFGSYSGTQSVIRRHLEGTLLTNTFGISLKNGNYIDSHIEDSYIQDGLYEYSNIVNSNSIDGRFTDTNIKYSLISGDYIGIGSIDIKGYDKLITSEEFLYDNPYLGTTGSYVGTSPLVINHKFYISDSDLLKIRSGIWVNFNQLVSDYSEVLNFFDNSFYLGSDVNGNPYISDNYGDRPEGVSVQLKSKKQNSVLRTIPSNSTFPNFEERVISNPSASIDLFIHLKSMSILDPVNYPSPDTNIDLEIYYGLTPSNTKFNENYTQSISEFRGSKLQIANIEKSIYNGGRWEASKINNPDYQIHRYGTDNKYFSMSFISGGYLKVILDDFSNIFKPDQLEVGDVIMLDKIVYDLGGSLYPVDGEYILYSFTQNPLTLILQDLGSQSIAGSYTPGGVFTSSFIVDTDTYTYDNYGEMDLFNSIHLEKIENTEITQGVIKRELFNNNKIKNDSFEIQTNLDIRNVNILKLSEMIIAKSNNLTIESGLFIRTFIKDTIWDNGIIYKSILKNLIVNDGVVKSVYWINGTFNGGIFMDALKNEYISDPLDTSLNFANQILVSEWRDGEFNGGEFYNSIWDNGNFMDGEFYNSIFAAGNWYNGRFGNVKFSNKDSMFGHPLWTHRSVNDLGYNLPIWEDGLFINGEFGMRSNLSNPNTVSGPIIWKGGTFRDGAILSHTQSSPVIWEGGIFNNGDIFGYVHWLDGTFNQGKFRSAFGTGYGNNPSDYAWVDGIFNSGRFGENGGVIKVGVDINIDSDGDNINIIEYHNPSWKDGRFNDGYFFGKIWDDGIFTGGRFIGNTQSSFEVPIHESFDSYITTQFSTRLGLFNITNINFDLGTYELIRWGLFPIIIDYGGHSRITSDIKIMDNMLNSTSPYSLGFTNDKHLIYPNTLTFETVKKDYIVSPNIRSLGRIEFSYNYKIKGKYYSININFNIDIIDGVSGNILDTLTHNIQFSVNKWFINEVNHSDVIELIPTDIFNNPKIYNDVKFRISVTMDGELNPGSPGDPGYIKDKIVKIDDIRIDTGDDTKLASIPDQFVMDYSTSSTVPYFGMWRNGKVKSDNSVGVGQSNFIELSRIESVRRFKGETSPKIFFENALWIDGEFDAYGEMDNSVWLNGSFKNGRFINSSFNPYVPRWDFKNVGDGYYSHALTGSCIWESGYLDNSQFYISEWNGGIFNYGDMFGGHFKGGISNYMNAYNIIWSGGTWKNGNWYGSNSNTDSIFDQSDPNILIIQPSSIVDQIITNNIRYEQILGTSSNSLFIWNVTDGNEYQTTYENYTWTDGISSYIDTYTNNDYIKLWLGNNNINSQPPFFGDNVRNKRDGLNFPNGRYGYYPTSILSFSNFERDTVYWGNGSFIEGVWENGVWNNGVRTDNVFNTGSKNIEMNLISNFFQTAPNKWNVELKRHTPLTNLKIGDYISVGNIVGKTVNDDRKFLKDSYQIIGLDAINYTITINIKTPFPLKSIEKDSENHLILVSKNVWENGTFHNGKFEGVWNSGKVEGYPFITVLENTQWIDGTFDGGRFYADQSTDYFGSTYSTGLIQNANINLRNTKESDIYDTWMDINYTDETYSHIWANNSSPVPFIETTKDILSSISNIWVGGVGSSSREFEKLNLGWKRKLYKDLIDDDLKLYPPETLDSRGWKFEYMDNWNYIPLLPTQGKFSGYDYDGYPTDNIRIDLNESPNLPDNSYKYFIKNNKLNILNSNRYWELSYDIVKIDNPLSGYITPYPDKGLGYPYVLGNIKTYHWNFPGNTPIISLSEVKGNISDIKFTEVDYIPFYEYTGGDPYSINDDIQVPKTSQSSEIRISERDAKLIDNKISRI